MARRKNNDVESSEVLICGAHVGGIKCTGIVKPMQRKNGKDPAKCTKCGKSFSSYTRLKWLRARAESKAQVQGSEPQIEDSSVSAGVIQFDSLPDESFSSDVVVDSNVFEAQPDVPVEFDSLEDIPMGFDPLPDVSADFDPLPDESADFDHLTEIPEEPDSPECDDNHSDDVLMSDLNTAFESEIDAQDVSEDLGSESANTDVISEVDKEIENSGVVQNADSVTDYVRSKEQLITELSVFDPTKPLKPRTLAQRSAVLRKREEKEKAFFSEKEPVSDAGVDEYEPLGDDSLPVEMVPVEDVTPVEIKDDLEGHWSDECDEFGHSKGDVRKILEDEAARLIAEDFVLGGINFNPLGLDADEALTSVRTSSIQALLYDGKTSTQLKIDEVRAGEARRAAEEAKKEEVLRSEHAKYRLSYQFASGIMTDKQTDEFIASGILTSEQLRMTPPTAEQLHGIVNSERFAKNLPYQLKLDYPLETVEAFVGVWKGICSDMCNGEFGRKSYWIAAETNWATCAYESEVIKTAFASGLSVTPPVALTHLVAVFEKSNNYLNDLEFMYNMPRNMRDTIESFNFFNKAYKAVYEGAVSEFTPKPIPPYMFTWRAYTSSDVVIVKVPSIGIATGGIAVLADLLAIRADAGLSTIIVSTKSIRQLNELNSNFLLEFFSTTGCSLISYGESNLPENCNVNNYAYFSTDGDASGRGSKVQRSNRGVQQRTSRRSGNDAAPKKKTKGSNK